MPGTESEREREGQDRAVATWGRTDLERAAEAGARHVSQHRWSYGPTWGCRDLEHPAGARQGDQPDGSPAYGKYNGYKNT